MISLGARLDIGGLKLTVVAVGPMAHSEGLGPVDFQAEPIDRVSTESLAAGAILNTPWGCCEVVSAGSGKRLQI